ncbi:hypothetical protein GJAV_G00001550 [Gymnothorax javanicus]|nr:hypothetical protein GJAV_G00001550 [Gymnothorax javanicus]
MYPVGNSVDEQEAAVSVETTVRTVCSERNAESFKGSEQQMELCLQQEQLQLGSPWQPEELQAAGALPEQQQLQQLEIAFPIKISIPAPPALSQGALLLPLLPWAPQVTATPLQSALPLLQPLLLARQEKPPPPKEPASIPLSIRSISRPRGRRVYRVVGRSRFRITLSPSKRLQSRSRSRGRSPDSASVQLSLEEKRQLLLIARENAAKTLGVEDVALPSSVNAVLGVSEEPAIGERVRPGSSALGSLKELSGESEVVIKLGWDWVLCLTEVTHQSCLISETLSLSHPRRTATDVMPERIT